MSDVYPISDAVFEYARTEARKRAAHQWEDRKRWNLWTTYHTTRNPDWYDPWFESEYIGTSNEPPTETEPGYKMTQNMYFMYCWLKYHGYSNYAMCAMITSAMHESTITGAEWEAGNHPYSSLETFDPTSLILHGAPGGNNNLYIDRWSHVWRHGAGSNINWTPSMVDGYTGQSVSLNCQNTWAAIKKYPLARQTVDIDGVQFIRPVYNDLGQPTLDLSSPGNLNAANGYGMVQWTPWTKLPRVCAHAYNNGFTDFDTANRHWQLSGTLHLMVFEYERYVSMHTPTQSGSDYVGQWIDSNSLSHSGMGAYFSWPYNDQLYNRHFYAQSCTWDFFAKDLFLPWFENYIANMQNPPETATDIDWCRRQLAMALWRSNYIHTAYADYGYEEKSLYALSAIKYWDRHPIDGNKGWSVLDIPRPRDLPFCFLDTYHISGPIIAYLNRRRNRNVRTVLL